MNSVREKGQRGAEERGAHSFPPSFLPSSSSFLLSFPFYLSAPGIEWSGSLGIEVEWTRLEIDALEAVGRAPLLDRSGPPHGAPESPLQKIRH